MIPCVVNGCGIGGGAPVRLMGVINCSPESFYAGSYVPAGDVFSTAATMIGQGAHMVDLGARSTAPGAPRISEREEADRMDAALRELDGSGITVSVDTMYPSVLDRCLAHDIHAINDISGLASPEFAEKAARSRLPAFLMASVRRPGDAAGFDATMAALGTVAVRCRQHGIAEYVLDPGIGLWTPERTADDNWELCRRFGSFASFDRPLLAAVSRKTFIGRLVDREPAGRLAGSLAVTVMLLAQGASIVRTHDVPETADAIRVYERMVRKQ